MSTASGVPSFGEMEIPRRGHLGPAPLSFAQELLWLMHQASPGLTAWNAPRAYRILGQFDLAALQIALDALAARHEVLRTVFAGPESAPVQVVEPPRSVTLEVIDLRGAAPDGREAMVEELVRTHAQAPFDLSRDHLLRAQVIELDRLDHVLCLNSHHIVFDGWSRSVLIQDLSALYAAACAGTPAELAPLPIQYADYAEWERGESHAAAIASSLAYWREQLAGPLPTLELPTDFPRQAHSGFEGDRVSIVLPASLVAQMGDLARANDVTLYMVLLAAYVTLLHRYCGQDDLVVGSPIAGRMQAETEGLIGYFANTLVLRNRLAPAMTFRELLGRVRDTALEAYEHQDVPFEQLVLELQKGQRLSHAPLFQAVLTMEDTVPATLEFGGATVDTLAIELGAAKFDLTVMVSRVPDGLRLTLWYRTELHRQETAMRLLEHFRAILESGVIDADRTLGAVPLLGDAELRGLLRSGDGGEMAAPFADLPGRIRESAAAMPDRIAVISGDEHLSFAELERASNRLAHRLVASGATTGDVVGFCLERGAQALVAMLGIMKSGAAYLPLAAELPATRLASHLEQARAKLVITTTVLADRLGSAVPVLDLDRDQEAIAAEPADAPAVPIGEGDLAYVLFTSGSTGTPKGVAVTHGNLAQYTAAIAHRLELDQAGLHFGSVSTLAADLGNTAIYPSLVSGGTLHLIPMELATDAARMGEYLRRQPLDVLKITPNHLRALLSGPAGDEILPRRWLVLGGEATSLEFAERLLGANRCRVLNHYGPTEATVGCCTFEATTASLARARKEGARSLPIGAPLPGVRLYVTERGGHLAPIGVAGELWIGGAGVAAGYLHRDDLTATRFRVDPFLDRHGRVYCSGDRVRRLASGAIEYLGRVDDQVKVRGFRVEPDEIALALQSHPGVAQAVVVAHRVTAEDEPALAAYVVARTAGYAAAHVERPTPERLRKYLAERLPEYMVPTAVLLLDHLPLGANGKVDRSALPVPGAAGADGYVAPESATEQTLAAIWADVLKRERVGVHDNFLALGGHSLLAIRMLGRISKQLGVKLPLRALFESPTVGQLALVIETQIAEREATLLAALDEVEGLSDAEVRATLGEDAPA